MEQDLQAMLEPLKIEAAVLAHSVNDDRPSRLICAVVEPIELLEGRIGVRSVFGLVVEVIQWHCEVLLRVLGR